MSSLNRKQRRLSSKRTTGQQKARLDSLAASPFQEQMKELAALGGLANHVSIAQTGLPTSTAGSLASMVYAKCCAHARSIGAIARQSSMFDHHAIMALSRMIIEATTMIAYLDEPVSADEWELRHCILRLQDTVARITFLRGFAQETADLREGRDALKRELGETPLFKILPKGRQERILSGEQMFENGMRKIATTLMGWNEEKFTAIYGYLSAHTHSGPVSFIRMAQHAIDYYVPSETQLSIATLPMEAAIACLRRAMLRRIDQRPDQRNLYHRGLLDEARTKDARCPFFQTQSDGRR